MISKKKRGNSKNVMSDTECTFNLSANTHIIAVQFTG